MFKLGGSREIDQFAEALVREFAERFPPQKIGGDAVPLAKAVDQVCNRAKDFQREKKLGIYGKARIGTSFKMELKGAGYPEDFVDTFTRQLLLVMSGK
jgi:hypothetical protein